jgi:flavin prenyltransferase
VRRFLVTIAGSTGVIYGIKLLERLRDVPDVVLHLVLTEPASRAIPLETEYAVADVERLADHVSAAATVPPADGMVIAPCDIVTAAGVAARMVTPVIAGSGHDLISRAAAETLSRGCPLIVLIHQSPLAIDHLRCLLRLSEGGAVVLPPVPAFYNRPQEVDHIVVHTVARVIDRLGLPQSLTPEWLGSQPRHRNLNPGVNKTAP